MFEKAKKSTLLILFAFVLAAAALFSGCHPWRIAPRPAPTPSPVPSEEPTEAPTEAPTAEITAEPVDTQIPDTAAPTETAVSEPGTDEPLTGEPLTGEPTDEPSAAPTEALTPKPTEAPTPKPTEAPTPAPEADIPPFSSKSITDGKTYNNSIFATAQVTMVNIWTTTCPSCIDELQEIQQLANNYASRGLKVLTILGDSQTPGNIQIALTILENKGVSLPTLINNASVAAAFPAGAYPTTYFIDSNGNILKVVTAANSYDKWVKIVEGLL